MSAVTFSLPFILSHLPLPLALLTVQEASLLFPLEPITRERERQDGEGFSSRNQRALVTCESSEAGVSFQVPHRVPQLFPVFCPVCSVSSVSSVSSVFNVCSQCSFLSPCFLCALEALSDQRPKKWLTAEEKCPSICPFSFCGGKEQ